jgi:uncharacterized phage protein gp47/JayE
VIPTLEPIDIEIQLNPDTPEIRASIQMSLESFMRQQASPGGSILISKLREAISTAAGEDDHTLISPVANITGTDKEHLLTLGNITWS